MDVGVTHNAGSETACFGRANTVDTAVVSGWFVAPGRGRVAGQITAFIDGEPAGQAMVPQAARPPDGAPKQARAFSYSIPWNHQDGLSHVLSLILGDGTAIEFPTRSGVTRSNMRFRFEAQSAGDYGEPVPAARQLPFADGPRANGSGINGSGINGSGINGSGINGPGANGLGINGSGANGTAADYAGLADPLSDSTITGWAVCRSSPDECVSLRLFIDGHAAGTAICDQQHNALMALGLPEQAGGFEFAIPGRFLDGLTHSLSILFDNGRTLPFNDGDGGTQSKLEFTAEPVTSIDGVVDGLHGDGIRGWAVRKHHKTGELEGHLAIQVLCNGIVISEAVADKPRMDIAREYRCNPCVGFEFKLPPHCRNGLEFEFVFKVLPEGEELAGCPLSVKHRSTENADEMRALSDTVGDLCAKAFKLQRQVRDMLPVAEATVLNYDAWARRYLGRLRARMAAAEPMPEDAPLVSIIMPVYQTNLGHLTAAIESVRAQTYQNWELIIVDDGSRQRALAACLKNYAATDERIVCLSGRDNRGISRATNAALRKARGTYVVLFDHDDLLVEVAVEAMAREVLRTGAKIIYSDEDKIDAFGVLSEPNLKPDWNYRLLLGVNYICHLLMIERALLRRVGFLRPECDGAQDHDLLLRLAEKCQPEQIVHLPEILYHWRKSALSTASSGAAKPYAIEAGRRAVADHLARRGFEACRVAQVGQGTTYSVAWGLREQPSATIIIPFKDQIATTRRCLEALLANTNWSNWRVVLVDNGSVTPEAEAFCRDAVSDDHVVVRRVDEAFNFSRLNNIAAHEFPADWFVFLNNDVFMGQADWLEVMMGEALADPKVAMVGAKLVYPNGTVQHGGVVLGVGGIADHAFRGIPGDHPGYLYRARCAQQYSAVTAACMLCRSDVFMDVGGFDEQDLLVTFNDVDLCLKVGNRGWRIVWTPDMVAEHHESLSRGDDITPGKAQRFFYENNIMLERWHGVIESDPHYNPHFSREGGIFTDLA